ncbi:Grixazone synthase [Madurella mycetomatis]|uniref:Grixazone synthase n=1 Tax=Madurella mycetomatis TaxID=100816 RepID=A0A175VV54_9PEZI|nr:Grixazone synthase [Madurella mycetomatis]
MKASSLLAGLLPLASLISAAPNGGGGNGNDPEVVAARRIDKLHKEYQKYVRQTIKHRTTGCTKNNILKRKEWSALSQSERASYIAAVHCLANATGTTPVSEIPGARTRYDDFVGVHLQQTLFVHGSGLFLAFHRYYVHLYEKALREECGYTGAQPYWDWTLHYDDPRLHPVFDGSDTSMGSNGIYVPGRPYLNFTLPGGLFFSFPPATGGGCIESGPFTADKYEIRLGPVGYEPQGPQGGLGYNPRCLTRDLSLEQSANCRPTNVTALLDGCQDLGCLNIQFDTQAGGVHGAGHFMLGGIEMDTFASPSDPMFWLHHAQVDRIWSIWQSMDPQVRINEVWGTGTAGNIPPSDPVTLDSTINFGVIHAPITISDAVSGIDGDLCYMYE